MEPRSARLSEWAKHRAWRRFHRSRGFRHAVLLARWNRARHRMPDVAHLAFYEEETALGPLQRDEALFIHALVRVLRPEVIVEVGFFRGRSALNFLTALGGSGRLYSFDLDEEAEAAAVQFFAGTPNFRFTRKSQSRLSAADVDGAAIDMLYIDASHDYDLNVATFEGLEPSLASGAVVVVHDTGTWARSQLGPRQRVATEENPGWWLSPEEFAHQPGERRFMNWIRETYPDFAQLHLHTVRTPRHGISVLQRTAPLPLP